MKVMDGIKKDFANFAGNSKALGAAAAFLGLAAFGVQQLQNNNNAKAASDKLMEKGGEEFVDKIAEKVMAKISESNKGS